MDSDDDKGWEAVRGKNKTTPANKDLKITDIYAPVQYYKNDVALDGHASGINFKIIQLFDGGEGREIVNSYQADKSFLSGGRFLGTAETSRACSEPNALANITETRGDYNVKKNSRLGCLLSNYALQHKKVSTPSPFQGLRLKINIRNSSRPPCVAATRDNPGIPCDTYLANFTRNLALQYAGLDVRIKVANPSVKYEELNKKTNRLEAKTMPAGISRYGYGNDRDGFNRKPTDSTWETK